MFDDNKMKRLKLDISFIEDNTDIKDVLEEIVRLLEELDHRIDVLEEDVHGK